MRGAGKISNYLAGTNREPSRDIRHKGQIITNVQKTVKYLPHTREVEMSLMICLAIASDILGGTALPICLARDCRDPVNK